MKQINIISPINIYNLYNKYSIKICKIDTYSIVYDYVSKYFCAIKI